MTGTYETSGLAWWNPAIHAVDDAFARIKSQMHLAMRMWFAGS